MRKVYSILFLFLFMFSSIGYYAILSLSKNYTTGHMLEKIEENVNEISGNLVLRIPINLPYGTPTDSRPINGEITYEGELYHKIKEHVYNDTLYLVCVKDQKGREISSMMNDLVKTFADQLVNSKSGIKILNTFSKDYISSQHSFQPEHTGWSREVIYREMNHLYNFAFTVVIFHPPLAG